MPKLTAAFVKGAREPGRYYDSPHGSGLFLQVDASGARRWGQRLTINKRRAELGLGGFPLVSLAEAREAAFDNRKLARAGGDPMVNRRRPGAPKLSTAVERVIKLRTGGWRDGGRTDAAWRSCFEQHVYPVLGERTVAEIAAGDILAVLSPMWHERPAAARKVKQRLGLVMAWSVAEGHRADDPSAAVAAALPKQPKGVQHRKALPYVEVASSLAKVREAGAHRATVLAFEFAVLTASRPSEARCARWGEIDTEAGSWTVPAERMKAGRQHRVPLSGRALTILAEARELSEGTGFVFPGAKGGTMSDASFGRLLRAAGIDAVPHGFRSSFRDWAAERTNAPREVAEAALAHVPESQVEAAYRRTDFFEKRRALMEQWAGYLSENDHDVVVPWCGQVARNNAPLTT